MDMQNVKNLEIPEGEVKTIHDKDSRLLWGAVGYDTKYAGDTYQQTYSGKNKFAPQNFTITQEGVTCVLNGSDLTASGKKTYGIDYMFMGQGLELDTVLPAGTYTMSIKAPQNIGIGCNLQYKDVSGALTLRIPAGSTSHTLTSNYSMNKIRVLVYGLETGTTYDAHFEEIQLEFSASPTSYEPFVGGTASPNPQFPQPVQTVTGTQVVSITDGTNTQNFTIDLGSTKLAKISNYQDDIYNSGDDWYVHKAIGKILSYNGETITTDYISTTGGLTNGATVYYGLTTPTDTQITDATLISQLNAVHQWLTRFGYTGTVSGNLPIIIDRTNL